MKKNIKIAGIITLVLSLIISVVANFYEPLHFLDPDLNQVDLSLNVENDEFQPIFISKNSGITEIVNAKMKCNINDSALVQIEKILINTTKISGLLNHQIDTISVGADLTKSPIICIKMKLGLLKQKHADTISLNHLSPEIREAFRFKSDETKEIITVVDFGLSTKLKKKLKDIMEGSKEFELTETQSGSICNINVLHEKN